MDGTKSQDDVQQSNLELNFIAPTVTSDGTMVFISSTDVPVLNFFQARRQMGQTLYADVVASIRINSIGELQQLQKNIEETIRNHTNREK